MLLLGVGATLIGAAARNIGLSPYEISLMLMVQNLGFMVSVMISGAFADTYSKPRILMVGSLILSAAFLTFYSTEWFNLNLAIMFMIGAGIGTYEGVTDAMLIDIHPKRGSMHININHFFVTFGSIVITVYFNFSANELAQCCGSSWNSSSWISPFICFDQIINLEQAGRTLS